VAIHGKFFDVILTQPFDARLTQKLPGIWQTSCCNIDATILNIKSNSSESLVLARFEHMTSFGKIKTSNQLVKYTIM
jgi:hypothetical protein